MHALQLAYDLLSPSCDWTVGTFVIVGGKLSFRQLILELSVTEPKHYEFNLTPELR